MINCLVLDMLNTKSTDSCGDECTLCVRRFLLHHRVDINVLTFFLRCTMAFSERHLQKLSLVFCKTQIFCNNESNTKYGLQ